jgi:pimeloyl-ACP methyl ester carboxylesterase
MTMPLVDRDGVKLHYEETGTGDAIVWLHEFAADWRTWEPQVRRFSRDYRCIAYNARGYPPSGVPEDDDAYGYEQQRDDLIGLMDALGIERAHLVGLSMGAYTALHAAMAYPDRVRSVVFSSGGSGAYRPDRERFLRDMSAAADRMLQHGMDAVADGIAKGPTRIRLLEKDPRGWAEFRRYLGEHSATGSALTMKNFQGRRPSLYDFEDRLRTLETPVLLAVGDEDDPVIEVNIFLKRTLPRAGLWVCPRTGHGMNLEEPAEYNHRIAAFLAEVERGGWSGRAAASAPGA